MADVTIGLAVYNGASTVAAALDSLLAQTYHAFTLVIADNGSTDETSVICQEYAQRDARVRYERSDKTVVVWENYHRVLRTADTPFFMWAAADDLWAPDFIATQLAILRARPDYVMSQSRVLFVSGGVPTRLSTGTQALTGTHAANIAQFLADPADNSRFYGLFRTPALRKSFRETKSFHALDWAISAGTLRFGKHFETTSVLMIRDETPAPRYAAAATGYCRLSRIVPLWAFSRDLLFTPNTPRTPAVLARLIWLNVRIALRFAGYGVAAAAARVANDELGRGRTSRALAKLIVSSLDVGMSERTQEIKVRARRFLPGMSRRPADQQRAPKAFGWRMPNLGRSSASAAQIAVVLIGHNKLLELLTTLDRLNASCSIGSTDVVVVDNGSTDATRLVFRGLPNLTLVALFARMKIGPALEAGVAATQAEHIIALDPGHDLDADIMGQLMRSLPRRDLAVDTRPLAVCARTEQGFAAHRDLLMSAGSISDLETLGDVYDHLAGVVKIRQ